MRFSLCLLIVSLSTGVHAFYPWSLKVESSASISARHNENRRFFPWALMSEDSDDSADVKSLTLDIKKYPVRRGDSYAIVESSTPTLPNSAALDQDGEDFSYFSVVKVGSQQEEMWLALDTGSPSSWVFSTICEDSACTSHHTFDTSESTTYTTDNSTFSVGYGNGTVRGKLGQDTFAFADLNVNFWFGTTTNASSDFSSYPFDGILGLGRSGTGGWTIPSFMDVVNTTGLLSSNIIGFSLSRAEDNAKDGEVNFGTIDTSKFDGNISYTTTDADVWSIPLDDAYVNGQAAGFSDKSAIIDTGTTYIMIPPADATSLFSLIPNSTQSGTNYIIPCNSTATLELSFSGVKYSISPDDYIGAESNGSCLSTIVAHQYSGNNTWLLGDVFLKNVYSVFDFDNGQVGFAARKTISSTTTTTATTTTAASTASAATGTSVIQTASASRISYGIIPALLALTTSILFL
ncbi:Aspartic-type endopeptidase ctsD [Penicillium macrosclerotiorum]|uniref:Aspartic-type endopeptidase ctsD n=1 Tax=Penicillium macrosclerotiorum TaxID=303699 RepID=UPI002547C87A|nr:Aspartic-type endopeptidase ctsD [Penicillium macrosclerotiorum]KAJ5673902.1 Aspartic-type endopeptidase ctsD [Penicillium macrosclerotiorum]